MPQNNEYMLKQDDAELIYQKKLTAGTNITIDPITNTISSTGGGGSSVSYAGSLPQGYGDTIGIITIDGTQYPIKVRNLIQGSNINIVQDMATGNLTISSTAQGTHVEANPSDPATARLSTIEIGSIVYDTTYDVFEAPETAQDAGINGLVPAPTYAEVQANKVLQADGTWVPQSGGGGNVADVYVNGTSVLDANDIAQVFSHEEITENNYDNLPSTKFSDNHMYLIKEAGTPPTGEYYNPVIYSEEEREIGVWTNDKPLYQKTIKTTYTKGSSWTTITHNISDIENIVDCEAFVVDQGTMYEVPQYRNSSLYFVIGVNSSVIYYINTWLDSGGDISITLRYTKTTDTAGSGSYNTLGVPNVHYTTDEQVIGTWIDGKPIYQKTYIINETIHNQDKTIDISDLNIKKYVNGYGTFLRIVNWASPIIYIETPFNLYESNINRSYLRHGKSNNTIDYGIFLGNNETATDITITIQYTKTTD